MKRLETARTGTNTRCPRGGGGGARARRGGGRPRAQGDAGKRRETRQRPRPRHRVDCSGRGGDGEQPPGPGRDPEGAAVGPAEGRGVGRDGKAKSTVAPGPRDRAVPPTRTAATERNGPGGRARGSRLEATANFQPELETNRGVGGKRLTVTAEMGCVPGRDGDTERSEAPGEGPTAGQHAGWGRRKGAGGCAGAGGARGHSTGRPDTAPRTAPRGCSVRRPAAEKPGRGTSGGERRGAGRGPGV